jgi:Holliday junction resolvase RusA-like endonuclease
METLVKALFRQQHQGEPYQGPVRVDFEMVYKRPKRLPKDRTWPSCKPDADNVIKLVLDSLNKLAYTDDSHVTEGSWAKRYTVGDEESHVDVILTFLRTHSPRGRRQDG